MNQKALSDIRRLTKVLAYPADIGNVYTVYRYYGISRETLYRWKRACEAEGD